MATSGYLEQHPVPQPESEAQRQQQFIQDIIASGKDRNEFDSIDKLARLVLRDGFKLADARKYLLHNLPYDSLGTLFKGREPVVEQIRANLTAAAGDATAIVAKQAIHGLGGVGKTCLAVEYVWRYLTDYSTRLFVIADSPESLDRNLAELCSARLLDLPEKTATEQEVQVAAVLRWLNQHTDWLLILDNVDTPEAAQTVDALLPRLQNGHVLITSRRTEWGNRIRTLALDTLSEDDATAFLLERTGNRRHSTETDADTARALAKVLDGLALALEQAGAFINKFHLSLTDYRQRWQAQERKLRDWYDEQAMHYPRSLAVTWETSFDQLSPAAQALLNVLSWFAPDPIPRDTFAAAFDPEMLSSLTDSTVPPPDLEDLLAELESLSLLKWETGNSGFSVHRLVQEVAQARLDTNEHRAALAVALTLLNNAVPPDPPPDDVRAWPVLEPLQPHIQHAVQAADKSGIAQPTTRLLNELGLYLIAKGLMAEAEPLMRRALTIDETSFGSEHPEVAVHLNNLGQLLQATHRLAEAAPLMRRALAIDEASFGSEHPKVAIRLNNLAGLLQATNRLAEAAPLSRRMLEILILFRVRTGHKHPNLDAAFRNHETLLLAMGLDRKAAKRQIQSLIESVKQRSSS